VERASPPDRCRSGLPVRRGVAGWERLLAPLIDNPVAASVRARSCHHRRLHGLLDQWVARLIGRRSRPWVSGRSGHGRDARIWGRTTLAACSTAARLGSDRSRPTTVAGETAIMGSPRLADLSREASCESAHERGGDGQPRMATAQAINRSAPMAAMTATRRARGREGCRNIRSRSAISASGMDVRLPF
jgi:hypothetical protein